MYLYFDTVVARRLGEVLNPKQLPLDVRERIAISPITITELFTQLTSREQDAVFKALQAVFNWTCDRPFLLPWTGTFIASLFGLKREDASFRSLATLINLVHLRPDPSAFASEACHVKDGLDEVKREWVDDLTRASHDGAEALRERPLSDEELRVLFIRQVLRRADVPLDGIHADHVLTHLSAYFEYQTRRIRSAVETQRWGMRYNFKKRENDLLDSEQLVYLADERLHLVTCDKGFEGLESPQAARIFVVSHECFNLYRSSRNLLERLIERAAMSASAAGGFGAIES